MTVQTRRFVPGSLTAFPRHWTIAWLVAAALCVSSTAAAQEPAATPEPQEQEQEYATRAEEDRATGQHQADTFSGRSAAVRSAGTGRQ